MRVGIIGGACHWKIWGIPFREIIQDTPYGKMGDVICAGKYKQHEVFTLQRHGENYQLFLDEIPWKANAYGMYLQNIDFVIHLTSCGSFRKNDRIGDLILFDQLLDFTRNRPTSLGLPAIEKVTYADFSKPISSTLIKLAHHTFLKHNIPHHVGGTMLTEEGPRYSSLAELKMFKKWGAHFLNQTSLPEICFCRELSLPVLAVGMVTNKISQNAAISSDEISMNIVKFLKRVPSAISSFLDELPHNLAIQKPDIHSFKTDGFTFKKDANKN